MKMQLDVDDTLERIGPLGRFQIFTIIVLAWMEFCASIFVLAPTFLVGEPPWECVSNIMASNSTNRTSCTLQGHFKAGMDDYSKRCSMNRNDWRFLNTYTSVITEWDLVCDQGIKAPLSSSLYFAGFLIGVLACGYLSDRFGRRKVGYFAAVFRSISGLTGAFSPNIEYFSFSRFCIGLSGGGMPFFIICMEISGVKHRGTSSTAVWFGFVLATMSTAPLAYLFRDWRDLSLAIGIISCTVIPLWWWIPESPHWLVKHGRVQEAEILLRKIAKMNGKQYPEQEVRITTDEKKIPEKTMNFLDMFKSTKNCSQLLIQWFTWAVISLVYYCVSLGTANIGGDMYLTYFLLCIVEVPAIFATMWLLIRFGRKVTTIGCMVFAAVSSIVAVLLPFNVNLGYTVGRIIVAVIAKFMISVSYNSIYVWSGELMPTVIRNVGIGSCSSMARIGSFSASYVNYLQQINAMLPFGLTAFLSLVASGLLLLLPETRGKHINEDNDNLTTKVNNEIVSSEQDTNI